MLTGPGRYRSSVLSLSGNASRMPNCISTLDSSGEELVIALLQFGAQRYSIQNKMSLGSIQTCGCKFRGGLDAHEKNRTFDLVSFDIDQYGNCLFGPIRRWRSRGGLRRRWVRHFWAGLSVGACRNAGVLHHDYCSDISFY